MNRTTPLSALILSLLLAACDGGGGPGPVAEDPWADAPYDVVECGAMTRASGGAVPLDVVPLGQVPTVLQAPLVARVESDEATAHGYTLVWVDGGAATLLAPIHPAASAEGGSVRIWVNDGTRSCEPFDFTVQPLPPAPGELAAIAGHLQEMVDYQAGLLETTRQVLVETPITELPLPLVPLAVMQSLLDHPETDGSLASLAAGTAPGSAAARLDLVEPILARTGLREALAGTVAAFAGGGAAAAPGADLPSATIGAQFCTPEAVGDDASLLDACMDAAAGAMFEIAGASGEVLRDMAEFFTAASMVPGLGEAASLAGFVTWLALNDKLRAAALLPSTLTGMALDGGPLVFAEDDGRTGFWSADVTASNLGYDFGKEFIEGLLNAAGAAGVFDKTELPGDVNGVLMTLATSNGVEALIGDGTLESFKIPPQSFGPVDVTSSDWSEARIANGDAVALVNHTDYEPRKPGTAVLAVRTKLGTFAGQSAAQSQDITVGTLQVTIAPDQATVAAKQTQTFTVTVAGSEHPEMVEIHPDITLQGTATIVYNGDGTHTVTYTAPDEPNPANPDRLVVRHTATTGARAYADREAVDEAGIDFGKLVITTQATCLEPGDSLFIEVELKGMEAADLLWTADAGTIRQDGLFIASDELPQVKVTVALADNPAVSDFIYLNIGGCTCEGTLTVDGQGAVFDVLRFYLTEDLSAVWQVDWVGPNTNVGFTFGDTPGELQPVPLGVTGTVPALGGGYVDGVGSFINTGPNYDPPMPAMSAGITENDGGNVLAGSVTGWVALMGVENPVPFSMTYRIVADPAFSEPARRTCAADPG